MALTILKKLLRRAYGAGMDFVLPPLCLNCDKPVTQDQTLCAECWKSLHFVASPLCSCCGAPFDLPVETGSLCGSCLTGKPDFASARSALIYDDASREMIIRFKHADRLHPAPIFARWMASAGTQSLDQSDVIIPVPLHRWRLLFRRYNQAALLALELGKACNKPVLVDALVRERFTSSQGHLSAKERRDNVSGAFSVRASASVKGKNVVLIDDVLTSGATVNECSAVLLRAGAREVHVLTLARTRLAS